MKLEFDFEKAAPFAFGCAYPALVGGFIFFLMMMTALMHWYGVDF